MNSAPLTCIFLGLIAFFSLGADATLALSEKDSNLDALASVDMISRPNQLIEDYSIEEIAEILEEMNLKYVISDDTKSDAIGAFITGVWVVLFPKPCDEKPLRGCSEVQMISLFEGRAISPTNLLRFNKDYGYIVTGYLDDDQIFARRYDFEMGGVPRVNIAASIISFRNTIDSLMQTFGLDDAVTYKSAPSSLRGDSANESPDTSKDLPSKASFEQVLELITQSPGLVKQAK